MKKVWILLLCAFVCGNVLAQNAPKTNVKGPEIKFDKKEHQIGVLKIGEVREFSYTYTNVGTEPLILYNVVSNCDCTEIEWSKAPVMPGKKGVIKVKYTAEHPGSIDKFITVNSNAITYRVILWNKGKVLGNN